MHVIPIVRVVVDVALTALLVVMLLLFVALGKPVRRGFYCDDDSIRYPYREDTISRTAAGVIGAGVATVVVSGENGVLVKRELQIIVSEMGRIFYETRNRLDFQQYKLFNRNVHRVFVRLYVFLGYMVLGALMNQILTEVAKYTVGRLRPHFIAVCRPEPSCAVLIANGEMNMHVYNTNYTCAWEVNPPDDPALNRRMHDARQSFPSGHTSSIMYFMTFTIFYLHARVYWPLAGITVVPVIQLFCIALAIFVSLSRIADYKHHWSDVLAGGILGMIVAIFVAAFIAELWERREAPTTYQLRPFSQCPQHKSDGECHELEPNKERVSSERVPLGKRGKHLETC